MKLVRKIVKTVLFSIGVLLIIAVAIYGYQDIPLKTLKSKYAPAPSKFISINDIDVHYRDEGNKLDSIPIIMMHGTGSSLHSFKHWATTLKHDYRVITMDLPAFGLTGPFPDKNYSMDNYLDFMKNFMTALGIKKCVLGGNSFGGSIAWNFTTKYPDMVTKLILINAAGYPSKSKSVPVAFKIAKWPILKNMFTYITPRSMVKSSLQNVFARKDRVTETLIDRYFELTLREGNRQAFIDGFKKKHNPEAHKKIKDINQKTLVLWGEEDRLIPKEKAYQFHNDLPNDTLVFIKDVGHVPMEESPVESLKPVIAFLKTM